MAYEPEAEFPINVSFFMSEAMKNRIDALTRGRRYAPLRLTQSWVIRRAIEVGLSEVEKEVEARFQALPKTPAGA